MLLIGNGLLYTGPDEGKLIDDGAVLISDERIVEVGKTKRLKELYPTAKFLDAKKMLIMPGFINAHEHIYSAFARGLSIPGNNPQGFLEILEGTWWNIDRHLTLKQVYYSAIATYVESIRNGVTFVNDHHASYFDIPGSLAAISRAVEDLGVRTCLCYEVSDRDGEEKRNEAIEENANFIAETNLKKNNMLNGLFGLHASFTLSDETLRLCKESNTYNAGYHIHISEGLYDQEQCKEKYGMTVVERLAKHGILGPKTLAGHCIHITERDMDILAETKTKVIHNPESNMGNAVGTPDVIGMLDRGIKVGLGTDGYTHDILESLKVANILQKHSRGLPDRGFMEALACLNNNVEIASNIISDKIGNIKPGYLADIILIDYKPNTPLTESNIGGHLMFGINGAMTDTTIINGKIVMKHRVLQEINEEAFMEASREAAANLWKVLNAI